MWQTVGSWTLDSETHSFLPKGSICIHHGRPSGFLWQGLGIFSILCDFEHHFKVFIYWRLYPHRWVMFQPLLHPSISRTGVPRMRASSVPRGWGQPWLGMAQSMKTSVDFKLGITMTNHQPIGMLYDFIRLIVWICIYIYIHIHT